MFMMQDQLPLWMVRIATKEPKVTEYFPQSPLLRPLSDNEEFPTSPLGAEKVRKNSCIIRKTYDKSYKKSSPPV
jgi:hypothetical protein